MEETINQRITLLLKENSITVTAMARELHISQTTLSMQLKGERALSAHIVELILGAFPNVSADWVMRGKGAMYTSENSEENIAGITEAPNASNQVDIQNESIWKAKYEAIKDCYDMLVSSLGGVIGKRNVG